MNIAHIAGGLLLALGLASGGAQAQDAQQQTPYKVVDGYKVDAFTMKGFRTWRAAACDRCHGANQEGLVGPSLINSLKILSKEDFIKTVRDGRLDKGMVSFGNNKVVMDNIDALYAYLKGRSDGAITRAKVEEMQQ
ncbi:MAG TPA: cytochrome c [Burkholderiaceae bacterium]|nr:cytochrome c [Burkholderiaceae bacterium]